MNKLNAEMRACIWSTKFLWVFHAHLNLKECTLSFYVHDVFCRACLESMLVVHTI